MSALTKKASHKGSHKSKSNLGEIFLVQGHHIYDKVDLTPISIELDKSHQPVTKIIYDRKIFNFRIRVFPLLANPGEQAPCFTLLRNYEDFAELDNHVHTCTDNIPKVRGLLQRRDFTQLENIQNLPNPNFEESVSYVGLRDAFANYISRLNTLIKESPESTLMCNEVLNWFCLDNMGRQITVIQKDINQPGLYTGQCVKEYMSQCQNELSMKPGDPITVLKICKPSESGWWYGKNKFDVGYFPFDCIKLLATDGDTQELLDSFAPRVSEVAKRHGKKIVTLKELLEKRPNQEELRRKKILKDLPALQPLSHYIEEQERTPWIVEVCVNFINKYGIVSGVYRKPGSIINVELLQKLFSRGKLRVSADELIAYSEIKNDRYCVASYLKQFFRALKDPLILADVFQKCEKSRLANRDLDSRKEAYIEALQGLPQDHWNTLKLLMTHLHELSKEDHITNMNGENLARIWTSNLVRHKTPETLMPSSDLDAIALMKANVCQDGDIIADLIKLVPQIFGYKKAVQNIDKFLKAKRTVKMKLIGQDGNMFRSNTECDLTTVEGKKKSFSPDMSRRMTTDSVSGKLSSTQRRRSNSLHLAENSNEIPEADEDDGTDSGQMLGDDKENIIGAKNKQRGDVSGTEGEACPISVIPVNKTRHQVTAVTPEAGMEYSGPEPPVLRPNSSARNSSNSEDSGTASVSVIGRGLSVQQF